MSLIALTRRFRAGRSVTCAVLLLIAVIVAIIVGLLAMHSLNTHTATAAHITHPTSVAAEAAPAHGHHSGATATGEGCAHCNSDHSDMLGMACVLALLATVLLLARLRPSRVRLSVRPFPQPLSAAHPGRMHARPPSLIALCISRT